MVAAEAVQLDGDLAMGSNKYTAADATGNTAVTGPLSVTGANTVTRVATVNAGEGPRVADRYQWGRMPDGRTHRRAHPGPGRALRGPCFPVPGGDRTNLPRPRARAPPGGSFAREEEKGKRVETPAAAGGGGQRSAV